MTATRWGLRAAELYSESYAERYRLHDEAVARAAPGTGLAGWLQSICERFRGPIDVLDLGCGTGRYFQALTGVRRLVGIDVSRPMLNRARRPIVTLDQDLVTLIEGDFLQHEFRPAEFDLVYSIGVLAEHTPFDEAIASRVRRWLRPGGRFAFTTVHPQSSSVPRTLRRRLGERVLPLTSGVARRALRDRLMSCGLYADEERVRDVAETAGLTIESLEQFESDVHLHVLAAAVKSENPWAT
jgi:ubiquinone/menaquinone biosynthesis C-methylase UbiE